MWDNSIFLICVTDFIDGKIARKIKAESLLGSFLDVTADFIFIISSLALLNLNNRIPIWFTVLTLIKFIEFFVTSYIIKKYYNISNNFFHLIILDVLLQLAFFNTWNSFINLYRTRYSLYKYAYIYNFNIGYHILFSKMYKSYKVLKLRKNNIFYCTE
ncbi:CDP-diacylglycerol--glycerol-3-phosphate 3-phosphatidyltransferase [Clostridium botulinum CFSAN002367]|nr:CDP-diacylglycerol--glycerol-3-phosphate 3-phosphatidyltransferase [Clostridium botulinum CFSAN002367]